MLFLISKFRMKKFLLAKCYHFIKISMHSVRAVCFHFQKSKKLSDTPGSYVFHESFHKFDFLKLK